MYYTVKEAAARLGVAPSTLRYYDQEGLLPFVERSEGGIRVFKDSDFEWLRIIGCLKKTGMALKDIRRFVEMAMQGDETIAPRLEMIVRQKEAVCRQIEELSETLRVLSFKQWYYETAMENGTTAVARNMTPDEIPAEHREVRLQLQGK